MPPGKFITGADGGAGEVARNTLTAAPSAEAIRRDRIEEMSFGQAHLELHPVPRLAVIERPLIATGDGMCAGLEVKIAHCAHRFNDVDDGGETEAAGAATTPCLISSWGSPHLQAECDVVACCPFGEEKLRAIARFGLALEADKN